ncbi:MAG TPA: hypothetical protein VFX41_08625 [Actinomycetales bacterium]|nr:hypothetical protein [Actinomycetales bacterium]
MSLLDRMRIARVVAGYDFWLEARGVAGRRRRDLRRELRANLTEAAGDVGAREAVRRVGSPRVLAQEALADGAKRPLWSLASSCGGLALVVMVFAVLFAAFGFADGVSASGVHEPVEGPLVLVPGSTAEAHFPVGGGISLGVSFGWSVLVLPAVVFLLVARPWRLLRRNVTAAAGAGLDNR